MCVFCDNCRVWFIWHKTPHTTRKLLLTTGESLSRIANDTHTTVKEPFGILVIASLFSTMEICQLVPGSVHNTLELICCLRTKLFWRKFEKIWRTILHFLQLSRNFELFQPAFGILRVKSIPLKMTNELLRSCHLCSLRCFSFHDQVAVERK